MAKNSEGSICLCVALVVLVLLVVFVGRRRMMHKQSYKPMKRGGAASASAPPRMLVPIAERNATCELRPGGQCWLLSGESGYCSRDGLYCMIPQMAQ